MTGKINLNSDLKENLKFGINSTLSYSDQQTSPGGTGGEMHYIIIMLSHTIVMKEILILILIQDLNKMLMGT